MNAFIQFLIISLILFSKFLLESLVFPLFVAVVGNYIAGLMAARKKKIFKREKAIEGLIEIAELFIIFVLSAWFVFSVRDVKYQEISVFGVFFKILIVLMVAYKGNSLLLNLVPFSKIPMPKIMTDFDNHIKSLFKSPAPISGMSIKFNADEIVDGDTGMTNPYSSNIGNKE